jgi:hypothetical protein
MKLLPIIHLFEVTAPASEVAEVAFKKWRGLPILKRYGRITGQLSLQINE